MEAQMHQAPGQPGRRQRIAAWIAFALALVYPLTVAYNATTIPAQNLGDGGNIVIASLYTGLMYIEWPLPIIAIFLASLVLRDTRGRNRVAWTAVILGAISLLAIVGVIVSLVIGTNNQ